jgi:hypothetical protein
MNKQFRLIGTAATFCFCTTAVQAQYPPAVTQPPAQTQVDARISAPPAYSANIINRAAYAPPVYPAFPGVSPYYVPPVQGYLSGVADVTNANGVYLSQVQQARLLQSQADTSKLDLRRRIAEEQRYERALIPTPEELRQKDIADSLARSRNDPPQVEIWSGKALNDLYFAIQKGQRAGLKGSTVPLESSTLSHINVTTGVTVGGVGVFKDLSKFQWPEVLLDDAYKDARSKVEKLSREAVDQVVSGKPDNKVLRDLEQTVSAMQDQLKANAPDLTPNDLVQGGRYMRELTDSVKMLRDPNAANYFTPKWQLQSPDVASLVADMTGKGLRFAPSVSGEEPYYSILYQAMVTYDYQMAQLARR